ncbi:MAG: hypothetical protein ACRC54_07845 [Fusobacteriaceae bacterium]
MKKAIRDIYILLLTIFFIAGFSSSIRSIFQIRPGAEEIYLITIFVVLLGISLAVDRTIAIISCGVTLLIYAVWIYYQLFNNRIASDEIISYYQWFLNFPIGVLVGGSIQARLNNIQEIIKKERESMEKYSVRDDVTLLKNKREFLFYISLFINIFKNKEVESSAVIMEVTDFKILRSGLNSYEMEEFNRYMANSLKKVAPPYSERFFLDKGMFGILLYSVNSEELKEIINKLKKDLIEEIKYPDSKTGVKHIPFKMSGITIEKSDENEILAYKRLEKGLEYDV